MPGQLTAFAGFRALGDLDLQLVRIHQILGGDTKARRGDLFDGAVAVGAEARALFASFAAVAAATESVHGDGESLVRLRAQ